MYNKTWFTPEKSVVISDSKHASLRVKIKDVVKSSRKLPQLKNHRSSLLEDMILQHLLNTTS